MENNITKESYNAAVQRLFKRFPSFQQQGSFAYKPGLEHIIEICERMGNPQQAYPCIHVAGTNGKGSTCNFITASLVSDGLKVGLYTSPHILDFRERMRIVSPNGVRLISENQVLEFLHSFGSDFNELDLSFFEITTTMAFKFFAEEKVDVAVVETGLGGRLDATNIIVPLISVITNIGYDHMNLLGNTLTSIAVEKAGIIKTGVPVVIGESNPETDSVFDTIAAGLKAPVYYADKFYAGKMADSQSTNGRLEDVCPWLAPSWNADLRGCYQSKNIAAASLALRVMGRIPDYAAMANAAHICDFHGRWEQVSDNPVTICDIGHNEHGLKYNFGQLRQMLREETFSDLVMVYGSVRDKDVDAVLRILPPEAHIIFTAAASPRSMPAEELSKRAEFEDSEIETVVPLAVEKALGLCGKLKHPLLYIGGSTYVVSEAVVFFKGRSGA